MGEQEKTPLFMLLSVADIEAEAKRVLSDRAWAYYSSAGDDCLTKERNGSAYQQVLLRPRVLRDISHVDTNCTILGHRSSLPIFISPAAQARLGNPAGEAGLSKAAEHNGIIQCVSHNASQSLEVIAEARESASCPIFYQLYANIDEHRTIERLRQVAEAGYSSLWLTVDAPIGGKREADERMTRAGPSTGKRMFGGTSPSLTWKTIAFIRKQTKTPVVLKGVQTVEDVLLCAKYNLDGVCISNHGGRQLDTSPPPLHILYMLRRFHPWVFDRMQVFVDGGITRGTDVLKALCLGATAAGLGRAFLFALGIGGEEGVSRLVQIMREEIETGMRLLGVNSLAQLGPEYLNCRPLTRQLDYAEAKL